MEVLPPEHYEVLLPGKEGDNDFAFQPHNEGIAGHEVRDDSVVPQLIGGQIEFVEQNFVIVANDELIRAR